ncbi:MAG: hypothetical protein IPJ65_12825 [Archangiaceae bacterium]|nr:hypothetical protein [Archangiaceae bacterium]
MGFERTAAAGILLFLLGCAPPGPGRSRFGHFQVETKSEALAGLTGSLKVRVGGLWAYDVERLDARTVRFTVQGGLTTGEAAVEAVTPFGSAQLGTVGFQAPLDARLERLVAFGASLTMGSQDASISMHSQLMGPAAQLARVTGAYLGLPLLRSGVLPALEVGDIDAATCLPREADVFSVVGARVQGELVEKLKDENGDVAIGRARLDPELEARNVAIGGFRVDEVAHGAQTFFGTVLEHLIWEPKVDAAGLVKAPRETMLDRVVALRPTTVVTTDLFGNDFNNVNLYVDGVPDLSALTSVEEVRRGVRAVLARLEGTGAELFVATGPDATLLPRYEAKVEQLRAKGYSEAEATGWRDAMRARIGEYNRVLREETAGRAWVHVVELAAAVEEIVKGGVEVDGVRLRGVPFGGLFSLDSMHFSDTGYAVLANLFLDAMDEAWGARLPRVDLGVVLAGDPYSVEALRRRGLECAGR